MANNARFWVFVNNGFVKVTLRPGQSLTWGWSARHDEGWSSEVVTWAHAGDHVTRDMTSDGRDCDGRSGCEQIDTCPLCDLAMWESSLVGAPWLPFWREEQASQYDQFAEMSNY